jgi:hypothetical protein
VRGVMGRPVRFAHTISTGRTGESCPSCANATVPFAARSIRIVCAVGYCRAADGVRATVDRPEVSWSGSPTKSRS